MFGRNAVAHQELTDGLHLRVQSIFPTIQGEGPYSGYPALFIRLHGCNLRCRFCDTDFESKPTMVGIDSLLFLAQEYTAKRAFPLVVITGGEPLLQNIVPLIQLLNSYRIQTQIETAGTVWVPGLESTPAVLVCSPKTPKVHPMIQRYCQAWKYIVREDEHDPQDGLPVKATQGEQKGEFSRLARPESRSTDLEIFLQPCEEYNVRTLERDEHLSHRNTALAARLCMQFGYRLSLQIHKIIDLP